MNDYSELDINTNRKLEDDLKRTKGSNTLYVSHYYFALNDGQDLIFYYNPEQYWDKISLETINDYVWEHLKQECAVFNNFDLEKAAKNQNFKNRKVANTSFYPETPTIGNHYSCLGNRIVSQGEGFAFLGSFGGSEYCSTKDLTEYDISLLFIGAVVTETPLSIASIKELECFKNCIRTKDIDKLDSLIRYPNKRSYPLPPIINKK